MSSADSKTKNQTRGPEEAPRAPRHAGDGRPVPRGNGRHASRPDTDPGSSDTFHINAQGHISAEQRPPQRIAPGSDSYEDITSGLEDDDSATLTPEEIQRETERWAPKTATDAVVDIDKVCRVCGKNLKGHRRYKDEKGYICPQCDRDERLRRIPCAECGKPVAPESLRPWGPVSICVRCWADHENDPKLRIRRKVSSRPWEEMEKKTVLVISAVALLFLLILFIINLFR